MKYFSMLHGQIFNTITSRTFEVTSISVESFTLSISTTVRHLDQ